MSDDWGSWLRDELRGLLREAVQRKLSVSLQGDKSLPPLTLTVEATEVIPRSPSAAVGPSRRKPRSTRRSAPKSTLEPDVTEPRPGR